MPSSAIWFSGERTHAFRTLVDYAFLMDIDTPEEYRFGYFFTNARCKLKNDYPDLAENQIMDDGLGALFPMDIRLTFYWIDVSTVKNKCSCIYSYVLSTCFPPWKGVGGG